MASPHDLREANRCDPLPEVGDHGSYAVYLVGTAWPGKLADGDFLAPPSRASGVNICGIRRTSR
jgi:hypothetical protein